MDSAQHHSVLLQEVLEGLAIRSDGIYVDATFGRGGHSRAILNCLSAEGRLLALDRDPEAVAAAQQINDKRFEILHLPFGELELCIRTRGWESKVNGLLLDLGVSSPQLDQAERGFSFMREGPLDMRMDTTQGITAAEWLAQATEKEMSDVFWKYGEERFSRQIARHLVEERRKKAITTTLQLADIIARTLPFKERKKHPATRTFQAIRIVINREWEQLERCLEQSLKVLAVGGRLCVISFHSSEDRLVKQFIQRNKAIKGDFESHEVKLKKLGKAIKPTWEEMKINRRARSAKLRIAERIS